MSRRDEHEPVHRTHVIFRCRRCLALHSLEAAEPEHHLEQLVATNRTVVTLRCDDGALAVAEVVGCGPGAWPPKLPERPQPEVVITEKKR